MRKLLLFLFLSFTLTINAKLDSNMVREFLFNFSNGKSCEILFSESFIDKVGLNEINIIQRDFITKFGKLQEVNIISGNNINARYEVCEIPGRIAFDTTGKVNSFWFGIPAYFDDNLDSLRSQLSKLSGKVSVCVMDADSILFDFNKDRPLACGSSFKLFVLNALKKSIEANEFDWEDSLELTDELRSLPSGILQNSPDGFKLTMRKAANLMISISDNTATDMLIEKIGRSKIEKLSPATMRPFYKTRELFAIKLGKDSNYVNTFFNSPLHEKYKMLDELSETDVTKLDVTLFDKPRFIKIEWYVTTYELCNIIQKLYNEEAMSLNWGFLEKTKWNYVAYKGGSEPGVLNYTYLFRRTKDSPLISLSASINNNSESVEKSGEFTILVSRLVNYFGKR